MNRLFFIVALIVLLIGGVSAHKLFNLPFTFLIVLILGSFITYLRRKHLGLKPYWAGSLRDIPKYFVEP